MRKRRIVAVFLATFIIFGALLNLLASGFASFKLMFASDLFGALKILGDAVLGVFGVGKSFGDFFLNFLLTFFQSALVALVYFTAKYKRGRKAAEAEATEQAGGLESSALVAGLAVLGSGCPTCGTTLLAPVIGAVVSGTSGAVALAGKLSMALNILAFLIAILVFKKLGFQAYAIIKSERYMRKKEQNAESR